MSAGFTYEASFDGIRIDVLSASIRHGRRVIAHEFPKRDGADLEDMGRAPFVCDLQFLFIDYRATETEKTVGNYEDRYLKFAAAVSTGEPRVFVHPYEGAVKCRVGDFQTNASGDGALMISASATFTEEISLPPVFAPGAGAQTRASAQDVRSEALAAIEAFEAGDYSTVLVERSITEAEAWEQDPTLSAREVQLRMASLNNELAIELDSLEAARDITKHPIMKAYTRLQYSLRRAAEAFTSTTTRIVTIHVIEPLPLRVIAARFYGAKEGERRFDELRDLNPAIINPGLIPAGTELKAYSRETAPRRLVA